MTAQKKYIFKRIFLSAILFMNIGALVLSAGLIYRHLAFSGDYKAASKLREDPEKKRISGPVENFTPNSAATEISEDDPASIDIVSEPPGAKIYIQGYLKGISPAEVFAVSSLDRKRHKITLIKEGYKSWEREIQLKGGENHQLRAVLKEEKK